jgi:hypothetical protein
LCFPVGGFLSGTFGPELGTRGSKRRMKKKIENPLRSLRVPAFSVCALLEKEPVGHQLLISSLPSIRPTLIWAPHHLQHQNIQKCQDLVHRWGIWNCSEGLSRLLPCPSLQYSTAVWRAEWYGVHLKIVGYINIALQPPRSRLGIWRGFAEEFSHIVRPTTPRRSDSLLRTAFKLIRGGNISPSTKNVREFSKIFPRPICLFAG